MLVSSATPGPWTATTQTADGQNFVGDPDVTMSVEVYSHDGDHTCDLKRQQADADWIAMMDPIVGAALADWLEAIATTAAGRSAATLEIGVGQDIADAAVERAHAHALVVARAILGNPS